jgi:CRP-like cAMP-binding protein
MKQAATQINSAQLRQFAPMSKLNDDDAQELLRTSITVQLSPGTSVFRENDTDRQVFYLLKGEVELHLKNRKEVIKANSKEACKPMGHHLPGQFSAVALTECTLVSFDADMLDLFLNWTNPSAYLVNEMATNKDHEWMNRLLQSRGLLRFSEEQINALLNRMNEIHVKAGDVVVSQDNYDDNYYYVIKKGKAVVSRKPDTLNKGIKLAELHEGDAFGEESLLTSFKRGATVTMQEDGDLMRLSKKDFSELLADPLLNSVSWDEAQAMAAHGSVTMDIRHPDEYETRNIPESINIPLPMLRLKLKQLSHHRKYIVYCDDGSRSSVAAFLLNRHGFDAFVLDGGLATARPYLALREIPQVKNDEISEEEVAREEMNAFLEKTKEIEPEQKNEKRPRFSYVDYWGSTVDEASGFDDSEDVNKIEKTKAFTPAEKKRPTMENKVTTSGFDDSEEVKQIEKTTTFTSREKKKPTMQKNSSSTVAAKSVNVTKFPNPVMKPTITKFSTGNSRVGRNAARNFLIAMVAVTAIAGFGVYRYGGSDLINNSLTGSTTSTADMPVVSPAPTMQNGNEKPALSAPGARVTATSSTTDSPALTMDGTTESTVNKTVNTTTDTPASSSLRATAMSSTSSSPTLTTDGTTESTVNETADTTTTDTLASSSLEDKMLLLEPPADTAPTPAKKSLDPATRGFIE